MAITKMEFSELSTLYSDAKNKFPNLSDDIRDLQEIEQKLDDYSTQIQNLYAQKSNKNFNSLLNSSAVLQANTNIDAEIAELEDKIKQLKESNLLDKKADIESASNDLNFFISSVSTNIDFQMSLRKALIDRYQDDIDEKEANIVLPKQTLSTIARLENLAKNDPDLKHLLTIDKDKKQLELFNTTISNYSRITSRDPKDQAKRDAAVEVLTREAKSLEKGVAFKGAKLQQYILSHKRELGIPSRAKIDFNDVSSPLYFISQVIDSKSSLTLKDTKELFKDELRRAQDDIEIKKQSIDLANKEYRDLQNQREKELQDMSLYPKTGKLATIKRFAKAPFKLVKNFFLGVKKPWKGILKKPDVPKAPTRSNIVDTKNNFLDAYKTEIGQDILEQIAKKHEEQVKQQQSNRRTNSHDEHSLS